jgi:hypothetical protein
MAQLRATQGAWIFGPIHIRPDASLGGRGKHEMMYYWRRSQLNQVLSERSERKYAAWERTDFWILLIIAIIIFGGFLL